MTTKKVLIVDGEADICELIEITLMRMDITSQSALNLTDAKRLLESEHFDLCLTDMRLPDGKGIEPVEHTFKKTIVTYPLLLLLRMAIWSQR